MKKLLHILGPGLLVAATGVGAGDLATAAFAGGKLGTAVLWAVVVGALLKLVLNEGLARWQLATDRTLLEGAVDHFGKPVVWLFLPYFALWSLFVGSALISACGVTVHAMLPVFDDPATGKVVFGVAASALGVALVLAGGYALFARVMSVCIAIMFVTVVVTAALRWPGFGTVGAGFVPNLGELDGGGLDWTVALIGGVGGTVTVLCYGYWIREEGRRGLGALRACRIDLAVGYGATALFGIAMVIIGSTVAVEGRGAGLIVTLAGALEQPLGAAGKWAFLIGAFGAVFSSLLGVWQAVPYLFADLIGLARTERGARVEVDTGGWLYRGYLLAIAAVPLLGLAGSFREVQKLYAIVGAAFMPALALGLLLLNGSAARVGAAARNRPATTAALVATLGFFGYVAIDRWM